MQSDCAGRKQGLNREWCHQEVDSYLTRGLNTDDRHKEVAAGFATSRVEKLVIAEHSEHGIHMYQPDLVIQSLRDIVEEVRKRLRSADERATCGKRGGTPALYAK